MLDTLLSLYIMNSWYDAVALPSRKGKVKLPLLFVKATSVTKWSLEFYLYATVIIEAVII